MRRLLMAAGIAATAAVPVSLATAGMASGPAGAAGSSSVTCAKLSGKDTGNVTITKCTPKSKTNKKATASALQLAGGSGTATWSPSGQTTTVTDTFTAASPNNCPTGQTEYTISGSVTGGTSTYTHTGDTVSADVCLNSKTGAVTLLKGTTLGI